MVLSSPQFQTSVLLLDADRLAANDDQKAARQAWLQVIELVQQSSPEAAVAQWYLEQTAP